MAFYLEWGDDTVYISDSYLRREILNGSKTSIATSQLLDDRESVLLTKLGVEIPIVSVDELLSVFFKYINKDNIDELSVLMDFNRSHLLSVLYLLYLSRISIDDIKNLIASSSYQTRSELLLSYLSGQDSESVNILMPLFELIRKLSNYSNRFELAETKNNLDSIKNNLRVSKLNNVSYIVNQGNYFYENFHRAEQLSLLTYCNRWKDIYLPDDSKSRNIFARSDSRVSSYSFINVANDLGNANERKTKYILHENPISRIYYYSSNIDNYLNVATASLRFGKWWHYWWESHFDFKIKDATVATRFTKRSIYVDAGATEVDAVATMLSRVVKEKFNKRLGRERLNEATDSAASEVIKQSFAVQFNHGLRLGIAENDIDVTGSEFSTVIHNIYSMYDSIINDDVDRYRYSRRNPGAFGITLTSDDAANSPLYLDGDSVGAVRNEVNVESGRKSIKYKDHTGYIDLMTNELDNVKINIANSLSNITNVEYSTGPGKDNTTILYKKSKDIVLNNRYFVKNHISYLPVNFDFKIEELTLRPFKHDVKIGNNEINIGSNISSWISSIKSAYNNVINNINKSFTSPSFYNIDNLLKYDFLIELDGETPKFANFGTTDFYTPLANLLTSNNISPEFDLTSVQNDPYGVVNIFKTYVDSIVFEPQNDTDRFVTVHCYNMLKKYIDYLLDDDADDIEVVLKTDSFHYKVYKLLFLVRHSILSLHDVRTLIFNTGIYKRLSDDPFRDNKSIERMENFYKKYYLSPTIFNHIHKYNIFTTDISNMYVGKISNRDMIIKL